MNTNHPSGTVTFLYTDIEGSTRIWQEKPQAMAISQARHDEILRYAIESNHGYIFQFIGNSFVAAFHNAADGLRAVLSAQRVLQAEAWGETGAIHVRMGLHTGSAEISDDGNYAGYTAIASTQRVMSAAHGGQLLLTQTTHDLLLDGLPDDVTLRDLGEHRLKDLRTPLRLFQVNVPDLPQDFPAIQSLDTQPNNLPVQLTSFIGREKEIAEIKALVNSTRLVMLTGSGGTGKTRLSIEVGTQLLPAFRNGVWLIELAALSDESQIIPVLAQAFELQEIPFRPLASLVMDYLRNKKLLLILDNCEHLVAACARLADDLLHQCAGLKILASSRESLGIAGEVAYHTPSLANSESISLFVERAHAANPKFVLTDSNTASVAQICSRLDGIPLAIELAAARTKLLSVDQIAARLDDLFRLLVGGSRTALPRQQTLRALIDWSYDLLSDEEKQLLRFTSVFVGGWTLEALEAVSDDLNALEHLEGLVTKSLVVIEERESEMRYYLLETIRQYAREKLFEAKQSAALRDRHFAYFSELSEKFWDIFLMNNVPHMRDQAEDEFENLRAALEWGLDNHVEEVLRLSANYCIVCGWTGIGMAHGLALNLSAIERLKALPLTDAELPLRRQRLLAKAYLAQGIVGMGTGNMPVVFQDLQKAIAFARAAGDKRLLGYSLEMYSTATTFINAPGGDEAAEEGYRIFRDEVEDTWGLGRSYQNLARIAGNKGDIAKKNLYHAKAQELIREAPLSFQAGLFYFSSAMMEKEKGNYEGAKSYLEDGLKIYKQLRNRNFELAVESELGHLARYTGELNKAREIYRKTMLGWVDYGNRPAVANHLECFAFMAITEEEPQRSAKLLGAAEALRDKVQSPMTDWERVEYDQSVTRLHAMLPEAEFHALWAEGRTMTMEQAIQVALA